MTDIPIVFLHLAYLLTTIIKTGKKGNATGFFFEDKGRLYLVTNKHVIYGKNFATESAKPIVNQITLVLHIDSSDFRKNEEVVVELFNDDKKKWLEHDIPDVDVILVPLDIGDRYVISKMNRAFIEDAKEFFIQFEKILVIGYPRGWYDEVNNFPIIRIGHLSSPFKVPFKGYPEMIGDAITHEGMSGSPVLIMLRDAMKRGRDGKPFGKEFGDRFILAGVYSGQFPIPDEDRPNLINIWFPETITDILNSNVV